MSEVVTQITMLTKKEVSDEDKEAVLEAKGADSLEEVAEQMEPAVEQILAKQFRDAEIVLLDVNTEVEE
ncbi:hypothetical protein M199_gp053 [Halogranum tailed virus 1]|uniref:Uncharacterized protein n=1 Tax=Halogranum tailed virus 1 TaxID=1273749 RepID=R4TMJ9_9CAUD|nr:hypothetical protein M199_gp053 [Halogranum tailed virus 1]AGM11383.1 hypothetical protein HGTV1_53 [Halogranum tailed virus 1]